MIKIQQITALIIISIISLTTFFTAEAYANKGLKKIYSRLGVNDGAMIIDPQGRTIFAHQENKTLIPASTIKILTSLAAFHYLGEDFKFKTKFYINKPGNLIIKGYGDPLLVSEAIDTICQKLSDMIDTDKKEIADIILDNSYFDSIQIPGTISSFQPYDSPNAALCVNFNTVKFKRSANRYKSAESQTPLLPFVMGRVKKSGLVKGRIVLSQKNDEYLFYAGHMFKYFLEKHGIKVTGTIRIGLLETEYPEKTPRLLYKHDSISSLKNIISGLMRYSNNFTANQIFIKCGIKHKNPPGTLAKGALAISDFAEKSLGIDGLTLYEGSGISRQNRISAKDMIKVLGAFSKHKDLMRSQGRQLYKTGNLKGINTRAGYIRSKNGGFYQYCVLVNTPGKSAAKIVKAMMRHLE
ncbi:D-alanyl-D-alanine carboxypeptidase [Desulfobacterales bacterium HSG16]|nr:D-alanyl-D-alanine carboxypeptidase [Desulfobacterales bacterium HSG16]